MLLAESGSDDSWLKEIRSFRDATTHRFDRLEKTLARILFCSSSTPCPHLPCAIEPMRRSRNSAFSRICFSEEASVPVCMSHAPKVCFRLFPEPDISDRVLGEREVMFSLNSRSEEDPQPPSLDLPPPSNQNEPIIFDEPRPTCETRSSKTDTGEQNQPLFIEAGNEESERCEEELFVCNCASPGSQKSSTPAGLAVYSVENTCEILGSQESLTPAGSAVIFRTQDMNQSRINKLQQSGFWEDTSSLSGFWTSSSSGFWEDASSSSSGFWEDADQYRYNEFIEAFKDFDSFFDGFSSAAELSYVMTNLGHKMPDEELREMIREADVDCDGKINCEAIVRMVMAK